VKTGARMPHCVGTFDADDKECEGTRLSKDENLRSACVYRDRCFALREIANEQKRPLENYVTLRIIDKQVFAYALRDNLLPMVQTRIADYRANGGVASFRRRNRPLRIVAPKPDPKERIVESKKMGWWLFQRIERASGLKIVKGDVKPGELFVIDRSKASNYKSLYLKTKKGRRAILSVYAKPSKSNAEVRLAEDFSTFIAALSDMDRRTLKPIDHTGKDGAFNVRIQDVDRLKASIIADKFAPLVLGRI
jgi:hypothetical protein